MAARAVECRKKGALMNVPLCRSAEAPQDMVAEVVDGALRVHPRPSARQVRASSSLGTDVGSPFRRGRGGCRWNRRRAGTAFRSGPTRFRCADNVGWRRETTLEFPVAEISPSRPTGSARCSDPRRAFDASGKRAVCAREGVSHLWFVDPGAKTLEAFKPRVGCRVLRDIF